MPEGASRRYRATVVPSDLRAYRAQVTKRKFHNPVAAKGNDRGEEPSQRSPECSTRFLSLRYLSTGKKKSEAQQVSLLVSCAHKPHRFVSDSCDQLQSNEKFPREVTIMFPKS